MPGPPSGTRDLAERSGLRGKIIARILGVNAALDRVSAQLNVALDRNPSGSPAAMRICSFNQIHAVDHLHLGNRMLDLDTRVHFHEIEIIAARQKFKRAGVAVAHSLARLNSHLEQLISRAFRQIRRGRFFDEFLVRGLLHGTIALAIVHDVTVNSSGDDLHLDMTRIDDEFFHVDAAVF